MKQVKNNSDIEKKKKIIELYEGWKKGGVKKVQEILKKRQEILDKRQEKSK